MKLNIYSPETLTKRVFVNKVQVIPHEVNITIYDPMGEEILTDECDIDAYGVISYDIDYDILQDWELGKNYRILWEYYLDELNDEEIAKRINDLFDLVGFTFDASEITSEELFRFSPYLEEVKEVVSGVATGGTKSTVNDANIKETSSFKFIGSDIIFRNGLNENAIKMIIGYSDGILTLDSDLVNAVISGDRFYIQKGYGVEIENALEAVELDLYNKGIEMENIVDIEQIKPLVLIKASLDICFARIADRDDVWTFRYEGLEKRYNNAFEGLKIKLSSEADGVMDDTSSFGQVEAVR